MTQGLDLTVVIPALHEGANLSVLLPDLKAVLEGLGINHEIIIVTRVVDRETADAASRNGATVLEQRQRGYGGATLAGLEAAAGRHVLTMDADTSHQPGFVRDLWIHRDEAEVVIASRYVKGGTAKMSFLRYLLSRVLNAFFARGLSVPIRDLSSGFRLYEASALRAQELVGRDFDILAEIVVRGFAEGCRVLEVPFAYNPRRHGRSTARVIPFGIAYLRTFGRLWKLRNSILSADYDDRAHDSLIPLQRYWQRSRFRHVTQLIAGEGPVLDVGCGSSRIIGALPQGSVALDVLLRKLRYARRFKRLLVCGSGFGLPFRDAAFPCVVCSQVIEHVPRESPILEELCRVLAPGGRLVLGTPDYSRWEWIAIEAMYARVAPGAYAHEHITHYTRQELIEIFERRGFRLEATRYIMHAELILAFRKPAD